MVWKKAANEMKVEIHSVWLCLAVVVACASLTWAGSPNLTEDFGNDGLQQTHNPTDRETSTEVTAVTESATDTVFSTTAVAPVSTTQSADLTVSPSASDSLSVTPTPLSISTTESLEHTFSSQPASTSLDTTPTVHASTQPLFVSLTTASAHTEMIAPGRAAGPTHQEIPSQLNVGDEDLKGTLFRSNSLDPLLAGLLSVFIVTTAVVFVILFLKFRHQNNNPEFHRLQDLPMDDLMEDTPLSRYTY